MQAMLALREKELAESKAGAENLCKKLEQQQMTCDKELNDLRTQLGQEMVMSNENKNKFTTMSEQFQDLKTKFAVTEEICKTTKSQVALLCLTGERGRLGRIGKRFDVT